MGISQVAASSRPEILSSFYTALRGKKGAHPSALSFRLRPVATLPLGHAHQLARALRTPGPHVSLLTRILRTPRSSEKEVTCDKEVTRRCMVNLDCACQTLMTLRQRISRIRPCPCRRPLHKDIRSKDLPFIPNPEITPSVSFPQVSEQESSLYPGPEPIDNAGSAALLEAVCSGQGLTAVLVAAQKRSLGTQASFADQFDDFKNAVALLVALEFEMPQKETELFTPRSFMTAEGTVELNMGDILGGYRVDWRFVCKKKHEFILGRSSCRAHHGANLSHVSGHQKSCYRVVSPFLTFCKEKKGPNMRFT